MRICSSVLVVALLAGGVARANPTVVVDVRTGAVVEATEATRPWYPASLSKLMTLYTAFRLMADHHVDGGTPILISKAAARQAPSKMGYASGTMVTVDDALKMLVVHSANDIAVALAENLGGSVEGFAAEMNRHAQALGMRESHWANPNGLPDPRQITSARDMAILARAILREFPDQARLFRIQTIQSGEQIMRTHNPLLYRYPGSDGMKTGFTCAAGFNIVATVTRGNQQLITVIMGAPTAKARTEQAVQLFESAFSLGSPGFFASRPKAESLEASKASAPFDMRSIACSPRRGGSAQAQNEDMAETESPPPTGAQGGAQASTLPIAPGPDGKPVPRDPATAGLLATHWVLDPPILVGPYRGPAQPLRVADGVADAQDGSAGQPAPLMPALGAIRAGSTGGSTAPLPGQIPRQAPGAAQLQHKGTAVLPAASTVEPAAASTIKAGPAVRTKKPPARLVHKPVHKRLARSKAAVAPALP